MKHLRESKKQLSNLFDIEIKGLRMPRMMDVPPEKWQQPAFDISHWSIPLSLPDRY